MMTEESSTIREIIVIKAIKMGGITIAETSVIIIREHTQTTCTIRTTRSSSISPTTNISNSGEAANVRNKITAMVQEIIVKASTAIKVGLATIPV